jgi:APA family basic amino acid/polyamine antiporter
MPSQLFATKSIDRLIADSEQEGRRLKKLLGPWSLVALGIGAIIGSGIFVLTGTAAAGQTFAQPSLLHAPLLDLLLHGGDTASASGRPGAGPGIALSFLFTGLVCGFAALCYAELASMIPIAGSAYTYSYATLGELIAWIIGWDLILEYAVGNVAVAVGFSGYLVSILQGFGIHVPPQLSGAVWEAGKFTGNWFNLPAFLVMMAITLLLVRGIRESAGANNAIVVIKTVTILVFVAAGSAYVQPDNWTPFVPNGPQGLLTGAAIVFFAFIGFDAVSTAAEEARNPQKDIPFGIIVSLIVCTVLYASVALVLTGMENWTKLGNEAPVANALKAAGANIWVQRAITAGALTGMLSVLLVFQIGQARIWFAMSRDGLFPKAFGRVKPGAQTPHISSWIAGFAVAIPAGIWGIGDAADLTNIGTLFAFILCSAGVLVLRRKDPDRPRGFRVPGSPVTPVLSILSCLLLMASLTVITWIRFAVWLGIGLAIYFLYSKRRSEFAAKRS